MIRCAKSDIHIKIHTKHQLHTSVFPLREQKKKRNNNKKKERKKKNYKNHNNKP